MCAQNNVAPVIIKKKRVTGDGGHHGGAWKVAYADFVTAMMAFFLLMWLLNATTEQQRKGISDYFSPTIPISRISAGGDGSFGGDSVFAEEKMLKDGTGASKQQPTERHKARGETGLSDESTAAEANQADDLAAIEEALSGRSGDRMVSPELQRHILTRVSDEGLVIELFDLEQARLFEEGTDTPTQLLKDLLELVASVSLRVRNDMAVAAHARAQPIVLRENPVWDLSQSRANRARLLLTDELGPERIRRMTGHADRQPVTPNPMSVRNNRVEVTLLR